MSNIATATAKGETQYFTSEHDAFDQLAAEQMAYGLCLPPYNRTVSLKVDHEPPYIIKMNRDPDADTNANANSDTYAVICPEWADSPHASKSSFRRVIKNDICPESFFEGGTEKMDVMPTVVIIDGSMVMTAMCKSYGEYAPATMLQAVTYVRSKIVNALGDTGKNGKVIFIVDDGRWVPAGKGHTQRSRVTKSAAADDKFKVDPNRKGPLVRYDPLCATVDEADKTRRIAALHQKMRVKGIKATEAQALSQEISRIQEHPTLNEIFQLGTPCDGGLLNSLYSDVGLGRQYLMRFIIQSLVQSRMEAIRIPVGPGQMVVFSGHCMRPQDLSEYNLASLYPSLVTGTCSGIEEGERDAFVELMVSGTPLALISASYETRVLVMQPLFNALAPSIPLQIYDNEMVENELLHPSLNPNLSPINCNEFFQRMMQFAEREHQLDSVEDVRLCPLPFLFNIVGEADQASLFMVQRLYHDTILGGSPRWDQCFRIDMSDSDLVMFNFIYLYENYQRLDALKDQQQVAQPYIYNNFGVKGKKEVCAVHKLAGEYGKWCVQNSAFWRRTGFTEPQAEPQVTPSLAMRVMAARARKAAAASGTTSVGASSEQGMSHTASTVASRSDVQRAQDWDAADSALNGEGQRQLSSSLPPFSDFLGLMILNGSDFSRGWSRITENTLIEAYKLFSAQVSPLMERCSVTGVLQLNLDRALLMMYYCYVVNNRGAFPRQKPANDQTFVQYITQMTPRQIRQRIIQHRLSIFRDLLDLDGRPCQFNPLRLNGLDGVQLKKLRTQRAGCIPETFELLADIQHGNYLGHIASQSGAPVICHPPELLFGFSKADPSLPLYKSNCHMDVY